MVAGHIGELVDSILGNLDPVPDPQLLAHQRLELVNGINSPCGRHCPSPASVSRGPQIRLDVLAPRPSPLAPRPSLERRDLQRLDQEPMVDPQLVLVGALAL